LLFGTGTTYSNAIERLTYTLSSLEALLLQHSADPVEFSVAERMGLLLTQDAVEHEEIAQNAREVYRLRARHLVGRKGCKWNLSSSCHQIPNFLREFLV
jgi:hypothetical protein